MPLTSLFAMQKVAGSNPISRFTRNPALERAFVVEAGHSGTHPARVPETLYVDAYQSCSQSPEDAVAFLLSEILRELIEYRGRSRGL